MTLKESRKVEGIPDPCSSGDHRTQDKLRVSINGDWNSKSDFRQ